MRIGNRVLAPIAALIIGMIGYLAYPNSSFYFDKDASTVLPIESSNIVMTKETVRIGPAEDVKPPGPIRWQADCEFIFNNKSESEEVVTMGYPDWLNSHYYPDDNEYPLRRAFWDYFHTLPIEVQDKYKNGIFQVGYGYEEIYIQGYRKGKIPYIRNAWNLHDLKVLVDRQEVNTIHKAIDKSTGASEPDRKLSGAYIWKMKFRPGQTRTVSVSFSFSGFTDVEYQEVSYVMKTGAAWADHIGQADIYWNVKGWDIRKMKIGPHGYTFKDNVLHWRFIDFEPFADITLKFGELESPPRPR